MNRKATLEETGAMLDQLIADAERYKREWDKSVELLRETWEALGLKYSEGGDDDQGPYGIEWASQESRARFFRAKIASEAYLARIEQGDGEVGRG